MRREGKREREREKDKKKKSMSLGYSDKYTKWGKTIHAKHIP